jgi:hypothetical protein
MRLVSIGLAATSVLDEKPPHKEPNNRLHHGLIGMQSLRVRCKQAKGDVGLVQPAPYHRRDQNRNQQHKRNEDPLLHLRNCATCRSCPARASSSVA